MTRLALKSHAEVIKLGRLVSEPPERLGYLERLSHEDLRVLRELATDAHYDSDRDRFQRIAFAATLVPISLTAVIARKAFGPLLCARIAGLLETDYAIALADRMPAEFLAELSIELDPRRATAIIAGMPPEQIAEVAQVLTARSEHVTMGRFVGHMTDEAIKASLVVIDDTTLLRISYVLEGDEGLQRVIGLMSSARLRRAIRAATEHDLWHEALDLLGRVPEHMAGQLGDLAAEEEDHVLAAMVATAQADDLWDAVLPVTRAMSEPGRRRFAELPAIHRPEVLTEIVRASMAGESWRETLPLVRLLPPAARLHVWTQVLAMAETMEIESLRAMAGDAIDLGVDDMLPDVVRAAEAADLWGPALRLLVDLGPDLHERFVPLTANLSAKQRAQVVARARERGRFEQLGPLGEALSQLV